MGEAPNGAAASSSKKEGDDWLPSEVALLTAQNHPFILPVVEMLRDAESGQIGMVTEYCDQGDLPSFLGCSRSPPPPPGGLS